jgi:hypothetical protein
VNLTPIWGWSIEVKCRYGKAGIIREIKIWIVFHRESTIEISLRTIHPAIRPKKLNIRDKIAKSVPKKLVIWPKILVTQFFWHRLSKFYFLAHAAAGPPGRADFPAGREVLKLTH